MGILIVAVLAFAQLLPAPAAAVDVSAVAPSQPVLGTDGQRHLAYELLLSNPADVPVTLKQLWTRDAATGRGLQALGQRDLLPVIVNPLGTGTRIPAGGIAGLVLDVRVPGGRAPAALTHRMRFLTRRGGRTVPVVVDGVVTPVDPRSPVVLGPPLRGDLLVDGNGCCGHSPHREAFFAFDDSVVVAQRYAIDFVRIDRAGRRFVGDVARNEDYLIYGDDVLAVADGTVVLATDGAPDGTPPDDPDPVPPTDALFGNRVVLDVGGGVFVAYGHLAPGTVRVAPGDRVTRGTVLGQVGNSGNSGEPHLHFQVMDAAGGPSALDAQGIPFVFDALRFEGRTRDLETFRLFGPSRRTRQMPLWGDVVGFG
jgi:hypothetical protein